MSVALAREVLKTEADGILSLIDRVGDDFEKAVELIMNCPTRVIITGIGKSGIIGQKISATLNSTGTPSFFLHPVEAMHGDVGMVDPRDVIMGISYSGRTAELNILLASMKKRGGRIIALTGDPDSQLGRLADVVLNVSVPREACPLGLAPTASTTAALAMGDALAVVLLDRKGFNSQDFRRNHPGGSLGERLKVEVSEVMLQGEQVPRVSGDTALLDAINVLNHKNIGAVLIINDQDQVAGILTDGDIRRMLVKLGNLTGLKVTDVMTPAPKTVTSDMVAADALSIMQRHEITVLPVVDSKGRLAGILHLHDLLGKGEFKVLI